MRSLKHDVYSFTLHKLPTYTISCHITLHRQLKEEGAILYSYSANIIQPLNLFKPEQFCFLSSCETKVIANPPFTCLHRQSLPQEKKLQRKTQSSQALIRIHELTKGSIPQKTHSKLLCGLEKVELAVCNFFCRADDRLSTYSSRLINLEKKKNKELQKKVSYRYRWRQGAT